MRLTTLSFLIWLIIAVLVGCLGFWTYTPDVGPIVIQHKTVDVRLVKLNSFFDHYHCLPPNHAETYLQAADKYVLDYRLLPALSIIESTCGKHQRLNNWWGWQSARVGFTSVDEGILQVTGHLKNDGPYQNKTLFQIISTYGPSDNPKYAPSVMRLISEISP